MQATGIIWRVVGDARHAGALDVHREEALDVPHAVRRDVHHGGEPHAVRLDVLLVDWLVSIGEAWTVPAVGSM